MLRVVLSCCPKLKIKNFCDTKKKKIEDIFSYFNTKNSEFGSHFHKFRHKYLHVIFDIFGNNLIEKP